MRKCGMAASQLKPGHRALRIGRWSEAGRIYLITTTTRNRVGLFERWECASTVSAVLDNPQSWQPHARLLCWVLMPDHWHGLIELSSQMPLSKIVGMAKGRSAHALNAHASVGHACWAPGFYDRALRREEDALVAARYIVANPVRAGLVSTVGQYPYWNCVWI